MPYPVNINTIPTRELDPATYLEKVCKDQFSKIARALKKGVNVLVTADAETVRHSVQHILLEYKALGGETEGGRVIHLPPENLVKNNLENSLRSTLHTQLLRLYSDDKINGVSKPLVIWHSVEIMLSMMNGQMNPALFHEPAYILNDVLSRTVILAFQDPNGPPLPRFLAGVFPKKIALSGVTLKSLPDLLVRNEAESLCQPEADCISEADAREVMDCVKEVNPLYFRRLVRYAVAEEGDRRDILRSLRDAVLRTTRMENAPKDVQFCGYEKIVGPDEDLHRLVIEPYFKSKSAKGDQKRRIEKHIFKTIILHGEPGTGKTLLAKWLACKMNLRYRVVYPSDIKASLLGASEANVRRIFAEARLNAPSMLIFDEMDALFKTRASAGSSASVETGIASTLLSEMAGFSEDTLVFVVGTTNRRKDLDRAFLRPGRGGLQIEVGSPQKPDVKAIMAHYVESMEIGSLFGADLNEFTNAVFDLGVVPEGGGDNIPVNGDHLYGLCRRIFLRGERVDLETAWKDLEALVRQSMAARKDERPD